MTPDWTDDARLLADLRAALAEEPPAEFTAIGKEAFAWRDPAASLAELVDDPQPALRAGAEDAEVRAMTFAGGGLSIDLEITADALLGQLVPPGPDRVRVQRPGGPTTEVEVDELGWFAVRPRPTGLIRLAVQTAAGPVATAWTRI
ncbi:hypothetical protein [Actinokineospora sp. NPDC004072]